MDSIMINIILFLTLRFYIFYLDYKLLSKYDNVRI